MPNDTAEFLLGDVHVTVVLMESNKVLSSQNPTVGTTREENWTSSAIADVKAKVQEGLQWWVDTLASITDKHALNFTIDFTHADDPIPTRFEPITQRSSDSNSWIYDFLEGRVQTTGTLSTDIRAFNHQQREANNTNWAFTLFVVNDQNDADHEFASGGLPRAFSFPGGQFMVTLATRPASTITHETGHIFWALDEYAGGASYFEKRGYYETQNTNAAQNRPGGLSPRVPSIMDRGACEEGGGLLCTAYQNHTSSPASLEMIGWRDSDGDGVFDVLDVPHSLSGTGSYDTASGIYRFTGHSSVQTLPNLNPRVAAQPNESQQSDITINKISRAQFRIDGGPWQTAETYGKYTTSLDLAINVPSGAGHVEIRTIDDTTGITSPIFTGTLARPASTLLPGISGFVFSDADRDGTLETGETGLAGTTIRVVDQSGQPVTFQKRLEPDDVASNTVIGNAIPEVTLRAIGTAVSGATVYARSSAQTSTGSNVFSACTFTSGGTCSIYSTEWTNHTRELRMDFTQPVTTVSLDAVSNSNAEYGRLEIYDANNNLLGRYTTKALDSGQSETMTLSRPTADIAYAIGSGYSDTSPKFDNLRFGPEATAVTDSHGRYSIPYLLGGSYHVEALGPQGATPTTAVRQSVTVVEGQPASVDFGFVTGVSLWQNPVNRLDVNNDGVVSPIDALIPINDLNARGSRTLSASDPAPPFLDVSGDGIIAPIDALLVINFLQTDSQGEAESRAGTRRIVREPPAGDSQKPEAEHTLAAIDVLHSAHAELRHAPPNVSANRVDTTAPLLGHVVPEFRSPTSSNRLTLLSRADDEDLLGALDLDATIDALAADVGTAWSQS